MLDTYAATEHNLVHVTPPGDLIDHDLRGFRCACGPKVEFVYEGWVVVHFALDGRL